MSVSRAVPGRKKRAGKANAPAQTASLAPVAVAAPVAGPPGVGGAASVGTAPSRAGTAASEATPPAFWICCRFPQLPLETLKAGLSVDQPLALVEATGHARSVLAANGLAESLGVRAGMSLNTAYSHCPGLRCHPRQPAAESARLRQLAETAYGFTPHVSLLPPDALLLECAGTLRLFDGPARLLQAVEDTWRGLEHHCEIGIAHTPLAATILAQGRVRLPPTSASSTPLAERARQALGPVPLRHLAGQPWTPAIVAQFRASGMDTLGAVLALPRAAVGRRFGKALLEDLARLLGERPDPRPWVRPRPDFRAGLNLLEPLRQRAGLVFPMHRLLRELSAWLRTRQLLTSHVEWTFVDAVRSSASRHAARPPGRQDLRKGAQQDGRGDVHIDIRLATPVMDERRLLALTELQLERSDLPAEIGGVRLHAAALHPLAEQASNLSLFQAPHGRRAPEELLDLVQARLGADALHGLALGDDHCPEHGWLPVPRPSIGRQDSGQRAGGQQASDLQARRRRDPPRQAHGARDQDRQGHDLDSPDPPSPGQRLHEQHNQGLRDRSLVDRPHRSHGHPSDGPHSPGTRPPAAGRPLWLLAQPAPLEGQQFELLRGPERIESAWWDLDAGAQRPAPADAGPRTATAASTASSAPLSAGSSPAPDASASSASAVPPSAARAKSATLRATVGRDYYVARTVRGELCWIYRQHDDGQWFLHGYFA